MVQPIVTTSSMFAAVPRFFNSHLHLEGIFYVKKASCGQLDCVRTMEAPSLLPNALWLGSGGTAGGFDVEACQMLKPKPFYPFTLNRVCYFLPA